ncbi:restriction endonuclease subunit S [Agathobaculum hominis]|uniref:Restriction endonuclease subunit S n=1 Tax=Agathobaculum hominis TaxID=2763014 RepID=A0ABR7GQ37_9FIRM|nr:restriction endonuclease subunit S [Agathobaculum hominis]MBC5696422.1 restriction endonuclease subunit S [Agathobaculum hominis]
MVNHYPKDWRIVLLSELSIEGFQNGLFYEVARKNKGIPIINVGDLYKSSPIANDKLELFNATAEEIKRYQVFNGDLFFTRSSIVPSGIAFCNWYRCSEKKAVVFDSHVVRFKTNTDVVNPMYLYLACIRPDARKYFLANAKTATMTTIDQTVLGRCPIPYPALKEQTAIAEAVSDADNLIFSLQKLIEKKKAIKQGTMQELLTGKKRLPGFSGKRKRKKLGNYIKFEVGFPFKSQYFNSQHIGLRLIKNRDLKSDDQVYYTTEDVSSEYIVNNGDVLVGMDGDFTPCIWRKGVALLNQRVGRIGAFGMDLLFSYYLLQQPLQELQIGTGATTVKHLSHFDVEELELTFPEEIKEQQAIAQALSDMDNDIEQLEKKLSKYQQIKQGMMQDLLTGRIRLV